MDNGFFDVLILSLVSGFTEFVPVSSQAHQQIVMKLFGIRDIHPLLNLFIHMGILIALYLSCKNHILRIRREINLKKIPKRRRKRHPDPQTVMDFSLIKHASVFMLLGFLLYPFVGSWENLLPISAAFLIINGLILHIPMYIATGNKDSRSMTKLDSAAMGLSSALGIIPGISRVGVGTSYGIARGADYQHVYRWNLLISIPALIVYCILDVVALFSVGFHDVSFLFVLFCLIGLGTALIGGLLAVNLLRIFSARSGISGLSYYCWGAALFAFILYLYT